MNERDIIADAMHAHNSPVGESSEARYPGDEFDCCADAVLDALRSKGFSIAMLDNRDVRIVKEAKIIVRMGDPIYLAIFLSKDSPLLRQEVYAAASALLAADKSS